MMKRMTRRSPMALPLQQQWRNDEARPQPAQSPTATAEPKRKHPRTQ